VVFCSVWFSIVLCVPLVLWHCWLGHLTRKKTCPRDMTYNVFGGMLNLTQSVSDILIVMWLAMWSVAVLATWLPVQHFLLTTLKAVLYVILVVSVCLYVCMSVCQTVTFKSLDVGSSYLHIHGITVKFGLRSENVRNPYSRTISITNNSGSIKDGAMRFACSMWFSDTADQMVWPPSLSRDWKWPHVTKCTHSRVVGLRLEGNFVHFLCACTF